MHGENMKLIFSKLQCVSTMITELWAVRDRIPGTEISRTRPHRPWVTLSLL